MALGVCSLGDFFLLARGKCAGRLVAVNFFSLAGRQTFTGGRARSGITYYNAASAACRRQ